MLTILSFVRRPGPAARAVRASRTRRFVFGTVLAAAAWSLVAAQQPAVERKVLLQQDTAAPGYQNVMVAVTIPAGGREGRHTHPGTAIVHVLDGELTLDHAGRPATTYKAGETVSVDAGAVHEGINRGKTAVRAIASFVVEKGKPLTTQVP
ncbi:MAG: cupin domain-containing protein [Acidobacteria bacterium]|nr:cupin domain-containing protein [Acidobacteriota bacterium]